MAACCHRSDGALFAVRAGVSWPMLVGEGDDLIEALPDGDATAGRLTSSAGAPFARRGAKGPAHPEARRQRSPRVGSSDAPLSGRRRPDWMVLR